jgi:hypothetical protein
MRTRRTHLIPGLDRRERCAEPRAVDLILAITAVVVLVAGALGLLAASV